MELWNSVRTYTLSDKGPSTEPTASLSAEVPTIAHQLLLRVQWHFGVVVIYYCYLLFPSAKEWHERGSGGYVHVV